MALFPPGLGYLKLRGFYVYWGNKVLAEYTAGAARNISAAREYVYSGAGLLATIEGGTTKYHLSDHISASVTTDSTGALIGQQGHYPFGEAWYSASTTTKWQVTSYERDTESGNDYAMMRFHVNRLGRFSGSDPLAGSVADPQSLNRYAHVRNDAVNLADPLGLLMMSWDSSGGGGCFDAWCSASGLEFRVYFIDRREVSEAEARAASSSGIIRGVVTGWHVDISPPRLDPEWIRNDKAWVVMTVTLFLAAVTPDDASSRAGQTSTDARSPSTLDARANALAGAINKTGVQAIANPCTVVAWYGAAASGAVLFSATSAGAAVFPETHETIQLLAMLYRIAPEEVQKAIKATGSAALFALTQAAGACNSLQ